MPQFNMQSKIVLNNIELRDCSATVGTSSNEGIGWNALSITDVVLE